MKNSENDFEISFRDKFYIQELKWLNKKENQFYFQRILDKNFKINQKFDQTSVLLQNYDYLFKNKTNGRFTLYTKCKDYQLLQLDNQIPEKTFLPIDEFVEFNYNMVNQNTNLKDVL